jgi:phage protein D
LGLQFEGAILNKPLVGSEEWTSDSKGGGGSGVESGGEVAGVGQSEPKSQSGDSGGSSGKTPKNNINENRCNAARNQAASLIFVGHLSLVGYPLLKVGQGVRIFNSDPEANGHWYVKSIKQTWDCNNGYTTEAQLLRSQP